MGISLPVLRFLLAAHGHGVRFTRTATIGVQGFTVAPGRARKAFNLHGLPIPDGGVEALYHDSSPLFRSLGAQTLVTLDADPYESAQEVVDLNRPIPAHLAGRFTAVFDGGSMEHVFDVRRVLANYRDLVAEGGHLLCVTAANNLCGHGFYQFSPEFFHATFVTPRGWEAEAVLLSTVGRRPRFFQAPDPSQVGGRVSLVTSDPVYVYLVARKVPADHPEEYVPQQADYRRAWGDGGQATVAGLRPPRRPGPIRRLRRAARRLLYPLGLFRHRLQGLGQRIYRPLSNQDLVAGRLGAKRKATESEGTP